MIVVAPDLSRAFDTVNYDLLLLCEIIDTTLPIKFKLWLLWYKALGMDNGAKIGRN